MNEARIRQLMSRIQTGELSRNRNFDAFSDPEVRLARELCMRAESLIRFLERHGVDNLFMELKRDRARRDTFVLNCNSRKWRFRWAAYLRRFELQLLMEHVGLRPYLNRFEDFLETAAC